jgi:hypothetical protein
MACLSGRESAQAFYSHKASAPNLHSFQPILADELVNLGAA